MVRLFVALALPAQVRERLGLLTGGVPGARWTAVESFHLTLRFIGEVAEHAAHELALALAAVRAPRFELTLAGVDQFGKGEKSRVLWIGVERSPALMHLRDKVESALVRAGLEPDGRKYAPHVTLARLRDTPGARLAAFIQAYNCVRIGPIAVDRFVLFSSWQHRDGPTYREEAEFLLD